MNFSNFYRSNVARPAEQELKFTVSDRFVKRDEHGNTLLDEEGNPILEEFILKSLPPSKYQKIMAKNVKVGKNKQISMGDSTESFKGLIIESLVYPDLRAVDLLDSYGVFNPEDILDVMFTLPEYNTLIEKVNEVNGNKKQVDELIEDVKNS